MMTIFENFITLKRDRTIKATIGMSREKFDALVPVFAEAHDQFLREKLRNKEMKCLPKGGPKGVLDTPEKRLFSSSTISKRIQHSRSWAFFSICPPGMNMTML
jgi:hypothetical protein